MGDHPAGGTAVCGSGEFHVHPQGGTGNVLDVQDHDLGQANQ
jgi:hypothetical protein